MRRYDAPQVAVLVDGHRATRSGPAEGARPLQPLLAAAGGELSLGRAVELPRRTVGELLDQPPLHPLRGTAHRRARPAGTTRGRACRPRVGRASQCANSRCRWAGTQNIDVGRCSLIARGDDRRVERTGYDHPPAGEQGPDREPQRRGVVHRAEHQVHVVAAEAPEVALLGEQRLGLGRLEQAGEDALGSAGGAAGQVDRPAQRRTAATGRRASAASRSSSCSWRGDDQRRLEVGQQWLPLARGQLDVHRDREDAPSQQGDHQLGVRRRAGDEQGDPVDRGQSRARPRPDPVRPDCRPRDRKADNGCRVRHTSPMIRFELGFGLSCIWSCGSTAWWT